MLQLQGALLQTGNAAALVSEKKVSPLEDEELKGLYLLIEQIVAGTLNGTEMKAIEEWLTELDTDPEVILYAYNYCKNKDNRWIHKGCNHLFSCFFTFSVINIHII